MCVSRCYHDMRVQVNSHSLPIGFYSVTRPIHFAKRLVAPSRSARRKKWLWKDAGLMGNFYPPSIGMVHEYNAIITICSLSIYCNIFVQ